MTPTAGTQAELFQRYSQKAGTLKAMIIIKPDICSHPNLGSFFKPSPNFRSFSHKTHAGLKGIWSFRKSNVNLATVQELVCKSSHGKNGIRSNLK